MPLLDLFSGEDGRARAAVCIPNPHTATPANQPASTGSGKDGREAIDYLKANHTDLLFLDIQMPGVRGFEVMERVGLNLLPPTIFVTAYHEYAVRAFEAEAIDYLNKPVESERLKQALDRVRNKLAAKAALLTQTPFAALFAALQNSGPSSPQISTEKPKAFTTRLLLKDGEKEILLPVEKIEWIEAAEYYCCIHARTRQCMLRETISDLADRLDPEQFVRIHRSTIVNLNHIKEIHREGADKATVSLLDGQNLSMSKSGRRRRLESGR